MHKMRVSQKNILLLPVILMPIVLIPIYFTVLLIFGYKNINNTLVYMGIFMFSVVIIVIWLKTRTILYYEDRIRFSTKWNKFKKQEIFYKDIKYVTEIIRDFNGFPAHLIIFSSNRSKFSIRANYYNKKERELLYIFLNEKGIKVKH